MGGASDLGHGVDAGIADVVPDPGVALLELFPGGAVVDLHVGHDLLGAREVALDHGHDGGGGEADEAAEVAEDLNAAGGDGVQALEGVAEHGAGEVEGAGVVGALEHFAGDAGERGARLAAS